MSNDRKNIYTFTMPFALDGLNEMIYHARANKYASNRRKQEQTYLVSIHARKAKIPKMENQIDITVNWYCKDRNKDKDNIAVGIKYILDGLQVAKIIKNDGWKDIGNIHHNFYLDRTNPRIEVEIKEIKE